MICPMPISLCTSTIETAVYENRTHGGVRGRELVAPSYSITQYEWMGLEPSGTTAKRDSPAEYLAVYGCKLLMTEFFSCVILPSLTVEF